MDLEARATTRLKYRFANLDQARAHVRGVAGQALFFYRDEKLRLLPHAPVCVELAFDDGSATRLLHGSALDTLEGSGTWIALLDTRPVQSGYEHLRRSRRFGCDLQVELRTTRRIEKGRMHDVSEGGARVRGVHGFHLEDEVELRLPSADGLTFRDLSFGRVAWVDGGDLGVRFDAEDTVGRAAVTRLLLETATQWRHVWEAVHAATCCSGRGVLDPEPPRVRDGGAGKLAL